MSQSSSFIKEAISQVVSGKNLSEGEAGLAMSEIMDGIATHAQIASFLTGLRMKGESVEELSAFARTMQDHSVRISPRFPSSVSSRLTDTCGTGGDKLKTFNVSTVAAFVISGAGVPVAKHGNRSFTSKCGSADLLERLGVNIAADPKNVQNSIEKAGIGFMFAPTFHPAMKHASATRKELGIRTVFNMLGPLTNPAGARAQLIGVYDDGLVCKMARVLKKLGVEQAIVAHGLDGLDEISLVGKTHAAKFSSASENDGGEEEGTLEEEMLTPSSSFGLEQCKYQDIQAPEGIDAQAELVLRILSYGDGMKLKRAFVNMVLINASAGLVASGKAADYLEGVEVARESLQSGKALEKLCLLVKYSDGDPSKIDEIRSRL